MGLYTHTHTHTHNIINEVKKEKHSVLNTKFELLKVSIIIPCYNAERYVEKCVNNILNQTYKNIEIILVDDCSKDHTKNIILDLEKNIENVKALISKENNGAGGAKSEGMKIATGEYITFLDCDDYLDNDYIEKMIVEISNRNLDIVISGFKKVNENGSLIYERTYKSEKISLYQSFTSWGKIYKREWLEKNNLSLPYGGVLDDVMFQAALVLCNPTYTLAKTTGYNYVYNTSSVSHTTLCKFKEGVIEKEQKYLISLRKYVKNKEQDNLLTYYAFRTMIWHLLKSGCNVGKGNMLVEYEKAFTFLEKEFPEFKRSKCISIFYKNYDRTIVRLVLWSTRMLYKMKLSRLFFSLYGRTNLKKLWPNT